MLVIENSLLLCYIRLVTEELNHQCWTNICMYINGNFILQYEHIGADSAIVTQKIFQLIGLANAVSISFFCFLKNSLHLCLGYVSIIVIKHHIQRNLLW